MPRDIPVGNGSLLVNFDRYYQLRDLYWPHVGSENHTAGHPFRFGVWVDGVFRWVDHPSWQRTIRYESDTLVTRVTLSSSDLGLTLLCRDAVDFHENLYLREITVKSERPAAAEVRLFFSHDFHILGTEVGDSTYYEPERRAVFHYKDRRWFLINASRSGDKGCEVGLDQWAVGIKESAGKEGTWRDAEDGQLSGNAVAQGSVDSTIAIHLAVGARGEATAWYWIAAAKDFEEATRINRSVRQKGPRTFLDRTGRYWSLWSTKEPQDFPGLDGRVKEVYRRSLLTLRTQIDNGGAVVAACDFDIIRFGRDTYAYMWPRDGALAAAALIDAGYSEVARLFFAFCHNAITDEGYLLHKYNPDGSLASSWHGWYYGGRKELPVQEDETALVVWALWRHFRRFRDVEFIKGLYRGLVIRAANWMTAYRDPETGLPLASWDLWEERRGVLAWTVGATWGGLAAAAEFAEAFGEKSLADGYRKAMDEIRAAAESRLWSEKGGRFLRMIDRKNGAWETDATVDASLSGLWLFGMLAADDPRVVATMNAVKERLWVKTPVGGVARYEGDVYHKSDRDRDLPGNPWFVTTLWLAQWHIAAAKSAEDLAPAAKLLEWAASRALPSGIMAEQVDPVSDCPLSVSPLAWSHAAFIQTVHDYAAKRRGLGG